LTLVVDNSKSGIWNFVCTNVIVLNVVRYKHLIFANHWILSMLKSKTEIIFWKLEWTVIIVSFSCADGSATFPVTPLGDACRNP
jgi:hypothetical protein